MYYLRRYWNLTFVAWAIVALGCIALGQRTVQAQNPAAGWVAKKFTELTPAPAAEINFTNLPNVLRNGRFDSDDDEQKFTDFFNRCVFPAVTSRSNRQAPKDDANGRRDDVVTRMRTYLKQCDRPERQVYDKLAGLTLAYMPKIANDPQYDPVARINAVLVIGEVNSPKAVEALLATVFDPKQLDGARVAAMVGLINLAGQSSFSSPEVVQPVVARMAAFVGRPVAKNARAEGVCWMHGQAADLLAALKSVGPNREVPTALLAMLNEKEIAIPLRGKAARALGKLDYGGNAPAPAAYLAALAELLHDVLSGDQAANRERVRLIAYDVQEGLLPFPTPPQPNDQELHDGLKKTLGDLLKETENPMKPEELTTAVNKAKESLDGLLKNK